jgi:hypothetical protein
MVLFPQNAPYTPALVSELMTFPAGPNDEQVDTLSLMGRIPEDFEKVRRPTPTIDDLFAIQEIEEEYWRI